MKTQKQTNPTLPSPVKFSFYLLAVALVCFLNWNALKASDPVDGKTETLAARLEAALVPVAEEEIELEDWMLTISDEIVAESEIVLEDWMLTVAEEIAFEINIELEEWMLVPVNFDRNGVDYVQEIIEFEISLEEWIEYISMDQVTENPESEIVLADWMLIVPDPAPAIEEWMVNTDSWFKVEFMATK